MSEEITLTRRTDQPQVSLAQMLKSQYISKELSSIFAATELRESEVVAIADLFMTRAITLFLSTHKSDLRGLKGEQRKQIQERLAIKKRILRNENGMVFSCMDSWCYAFGLARQSLKRQSRKEAMTISMSPRPVTGTTDISTKDKLFSKLGISRKYRTLYVEE